MVQNGITIARDSHSGTGRLIFLPVVNLCVFFAAGGVGILSDLNNRKKCPYYWTPAKTKSSQALVLCL